MKPLHVAGAILAAAIWGLNFVGIRLGLDDLPPLLFNALRFTFCAIPLVFFIGHPGTHWRWVLLAGTVFGVLLFSFMFIGVQLGTPPGLASVIVQTQGLWTVAFAMLLLGERPAPAQLAGLAVAIAGLAVIGMDMGGRGSVAAFLWVVGAAVSWGSYNIVVAKARPQRMLAFIAWMSLVAAPPLLFLSLLVEGPDRIVAALTGLATGAMPKGLLALAYIVLAGTFVGQVIWGRLLNLYPASRIGPFALLVPVFGMTASGMLLGETFPPLRIAGCILIVAGLILNLWAAMAMDRARWRAYHEADS